MNIWKIWEYIKLFFRFGKNVTPLIESPKPKTTEEFKLSPEILALGDYKERVHSSKFLRFKAVPVKQINYPLMVLEEPSAESDLTFGILVAIAVLVLGTLIVMKLKNKLIKVKPVEQEPKEILDLNRDEQEPMEFPDVKAGAESQEELLDLNCVEQEPQECLDLNRVEQEPQECLDLHPIDQKPEEFLVLKVEAESQTDDQVDQNSMPEELAGWSKLFMGFRILSEEEIMAKPQVDD